SGHGGAVLPPGRPSSSELRGALSRRGTGLCGGGLLVEEGRQGLAMSSVAEGTFEIINALGLHARAAAQLVQVANRYKSEVTLMCEGQKANAKSIMGVLMLASAHGVELAVMANSQRA